MLPPPTSKANCARGRGEEKGRRRGGEGRRGISPDREPPRRGRESHPATRRVRELKVPKAQKGGRRRVEVRGVGGV